MKKESAKIEKILAQLKAAVADRSKELKLVEKLEALLRQTEQIDGRENREDEVMPESIHLFPQWEAEHAREQGEQEAFGLPSAFKSEGADYALFTDGACRGNPGVGAWACLGQTRTGALLWTMSGVELMTTNNRMELEGAIQGLQQLRTYLVEQGQSVRLVKVHLYSDSQYLVRGMQEWLAGWKRRNWTKSDGKVPENLEQWKKLDELKESFVQLKLNWVKGHSGHPQNEYCDQLCNQSLDEAGF